MTRQWGSWHLVHLCLICQNCSSVSVKALMAERFLQISAALLLMGNTCVLLRGRAGMEERLGNSSLCSAQPGVSGHGALLLSHRELPTSELCIRPRSPGEPPGTMCGRFCPGSAVSWLSPPGPDVGCVSIMSAITVTQENLLSAKGYTFSR